MSNKLEEGSLADKGSSEKDARVISMYGGIIPTLTLHTKYIGAESVIEKLAHFLNDRYGLILGEEYRVMGVELHRAVNPSTGESIDVAAGAKTGQNSAGDAFCIGVIVNEDNFVKKAGYIRQVFDKLKEKPKALYVPILVR